MTPELFVVIGLLLAVLLLMFIFAPDKPPNEEMPRNDDQPLSNYNAEYFEEWKSQEDVPCISCGWKIRRVTGVITSQGFKCQRCFSVDNAIKKARNF